MPSSWRGRAGAGGGSGSSDGISGHGQRERPCDMEKRGSARTRSRFISGTENRVQAFARRPVSNDSEIDGGGCGNKDATTPGVCRVTKARRTEGEGRGKVGTATNPHSDRGGAARRGTFAVGAPSVSNTPRPWQWSHLGATVLCRTALSRRPQRLPRHRPSRPRFVHDDVVTHR